jgi:hypothetical protein
MRVVRRMLRVAETVVTTRTESIIAGLEHYIAVHDYD